MVQSRCPSWRLYLRFLGSKKLYMFHPSFRFHQFHPSKSQKKKCMNLSFNWIPILGSGWILLTTWLGPSERRALPYPVQRVDHSDVSMTNGGVFGSLIFPILQTCSHYLQWFSVILGRLWRILFRKSPKVSKFLVRNCKDDLPLWGRNSPLSWGGHCYSRSMAMSPGDYSDSWFFQKVVCRGKLHLFRIFQAKIWQFTTQLAFEMPELQMLWKGLFRLFCARARLSKFWRCCQGLGFWKHMDVRFDGLEGEKAFHHVSKTNNSQCMHFVTDVNSIELKLTTAIDCLRGEWICRKRRKNTLRCKNINILFIIYKIIK